MEAANGKSGDLLKILLDDKSKRSIIYDNIPTPARALRGLHNLNELESMLYRFKEKTR